MARYLPQEIVRLPGYGRYVWEPALGLVDFIRQGHQRASYSLALQEKHNTLAEVIRAVARDLNKPDQVRWILDGKR